MDTIGQRLDYAINNYLKPEGRRRGRALLIDKLKDQRGATFPSIKSYVSDEQVPSVEFLTAAAEVMGVRPAWLICGDGPPTRAGEVAAKGSADATQELVDEIADALREGFPAIANQIQGRGIDAAWRAWDQVFGWEAARLREGQKMDSSVDLARRVGDAFQAPLRSLGVRHAELSLWQLGSYATLVGQAIEIVAATPRILKPTPEVAAPEEVGDGEA